MSDNYIASMMANFSAVNILEEVVGAYLYTEFCVEYMSKTYVFGWLGDIGVYVLGVSQFAMYDFIEIVR